jgi:hypothetical protein
LVELDSSLRILPLRLLAGCTSTNSQISNSSSFYSDSSSTTPPRAGWSSTTTTLRVRVPRHVARLVTRLVVVYFDYAARPRASARRVARHAARRAARRQLLRLAQARRRLFGLHRASGCLGTSRGLSCGSSSTTPPRAARRRLLRLCCASECLSTSRRSSSTTSPMPRIRVPRHVARLVALLVIDYFTYVARPGATARRAARR